MEMKNKLLRYTVIIASLEKPVFHSDLWALEKNLKFREGN